MRNSTTFNKLNENLNSPSIFQQNQMKMTSPRVVFTSLDSTTTAISVIDRLYAAQKSTKPSGGDSNQFACHLVTKYYTADVDLCPVDDVDDTNEEADALVLAFDGKTFDEDKASAMVEQLFSDLLLLVCDTIADDIREATQSWCVTNACELIELTPSADAIEEAVECNEHHGVDRLLQALASHTWENAVMLDNTPVVNSAAATNGHSTAADCGTAPTKATSSAVEPPSVAEVVDHAEQDSVKFEQLFSKFAQMKSQADNMTPEARKAFAEKVALDFMTACGDDDEESELSD